MDIALAETTEFAPHFVGKSLGFRHANPMLEEAFRLRFQVYCVECGFLPAEDYPDGLEIDAYDDRSAHFCTMDRAGRMAGYVRLVLPDERGELPFRQFCTPHAGQTLPPPGESAEISRLMVRNDYRRRRGDTYTGLPDETKLAAAGGERRSDSPQMVLSLYRQMYAYSRANGIRYWYAAMERVLARSLTRLNFTFRQVGPETDYYGPVAPYVADLRELERQVGQSNPALLAWMQAAESERH